MALILEKEELELTDSLYHDEFVKDFHEEQLYCLDTSINKKPSNNMCDPPTGDQIFPKIKDGPAKSLHRALAAKTHPDITGDDHDFKKIQCAYEEGDLASMLISSLDLGLEIQLSIDDLTILEKQISDQLESLTKIKESIRWAWSTSNKSDDMRNIIQKALGIDPEIFRSWKEAQLND